MHENKAVKEKDSGVEANGREPENDSQIPKEAVHISSPNTPSHLDDMGKKKTTENKTVGIKTEKMPTSDDDGDYDDWHGLFAKKSAEEKGKSMPLLKLAWNLTFLQPFTRKARAESTIFLSR